MSAIKATIMKTDLYDNPNYIGAILDLPATRYEIQDALQKARITEQDDFRTMEYICELSFLDDLIPENTPLNELNYLAQQISNLDDYERRVFQGRVLMGEEPIDMQRLINITYNLTDCIYIAEVTNDAELGEFYVENDFIEEFESVADEILQYIDYEKVGCKRKEAENGIFIDNGYVVDNSSDFEIVYDGSNIPEYEDSEYVFKLCLAKGSESDMQEKDGVWISLPTTISEVGKVLNTLGAKSLDECIILRSISSIPKINNISAFEDIEKLQTLAGKISEISDEQTIVKYKAVLEYEDCTDIDFAVDILENLNCYNFYTGLLSPEEYGRMSFCKYASIPVDDKALKLLHFTDYGIAQMKIDGVKPTDYGLICKNENEFQYEYCQGKLIQQMKLL